MTNTMAETIAIVNQKGGVGKTTTALNMGYALSKKGKKVLLIDFDPQSSLTVCFGFDNTDQIETSIATLMGNAIEEKDLPDPDKFIINASENLDFIGCNLELSAIEVSLVNAISREQILKSILTEIKTKREYDYIIIDCSPSLGMLTINALSACDSVIIPVTPQFLSAKGLELLLKNIIRVKKFINPNIKVEGILLTMYSERTKLSKEVESLITEAYGSQIKIYNTKIPTSVKVGEANMNSKAVLEFDPKHKVSEAYRNFANEVC